MLARFLLSMPWKSFKTGNEYCVFKLNEAGEKTGSSLGCHMSKEEANQQVAALNASEEKEKPEEQEEKEVMVSEIVDDTYVPFGVTSFVELDAVLDANATGQAVKTVATQFQDMVNNIFMSDDIEDKAAAIATLTNELAARMNSETKEADEEPAFDEASLIDKAIAKFKEMVGIKEKEKSDGGFYVWKEADDTYRWMSVYSNNIKDNDNPPDIIASESHKRFVEMVDKGLAPLPELWLWHVKEWKWGEATAVAYDDSGFAVAIGTVDDNPAAQAVADWLKERDDILTSHGMPRSTVKREQDEKGNQVIVEHITKEISPLFDFAAANKYTGFSIIKETETMAIPQKKKDEFIKQGLAAPVLDELEATNEVTDKETSEEGLEKKEGEQPETQETTTQEVNPEAVTQEAVAGAIASVVKPLIDQVAQLSEQVKELSKDDATKIAEKAASTPTASLEALTWDSIFGKETKVDGRSTLVKSKPVEAEATPDDDWFIRPWVTGGKNE